MPLRGQASSYRHVCPKAATRRKEPRALSRGHHIPTKHGRRTRPRPRPRAERKSRRSLRLIRPPSPSARRAAALVMTPPRACSTCRGGSTPTATPPKPRSRNRPWGRSGRSKERMSFRTTSPWTALPLPAPNVGGAPLRGGIQGEVEGEVLQKARQT